MYEYPDYTGKHTFSDFIRKQDEIAKALQPIVPRPSLPA